jgi:hypothetical protein
VKAALVVVVALLLASCARSSVIQQSVSIANKDSNFSTATKAGVSAARIAGILRRDGNSCARRHGVGDARCESRLAASAYAQVLAVTILDCTAPDRADARRQTVRYLRAVGRTRATDKLPAVPRIPRCG